MVTGIEPLRGVVPLVALSVSHAQSPVAEEIQLMAAGPALTFSVEVPGTVTPATLLKRMEPPVTDNCPTFKVTDSTAPGNVPAVSHGAGIHSGCAAGGARGAHGYAGIERRGSASRE